MAAYTPSNGESLVEAQGLESEIGLSDAHRVAQAANGVHNGGDRIRHVVPLIEPEGLGLKDAHRVAEAANGMHDGHGPVGHRVELVEAARLEAAGHEQQVDARRDAVRHRDAEAHPPAALLVPVALHLPALASHQVTDWPY